SSSRIDSLTTSQKSKSFFIARPKNPIHLKRLFPNPITAHKLTRSSQSTSKYCPFCL
ncbi:unnamed protein product, partial [Amoebophrya sp. A120]